MLIKKDGTILDVTKGAYNALFEDKGWKPTKKKELVDRKLNFMSPKPTKETISEKSSEIPFENMYNEENLEEDYETVYEDMTVKELLYFAKENEIDLGGETKKSDIIRIIKRVLGED